MKKLFSLLAAIALVFTLAACSPETVIEYVEKEVEVPVVETVTEYIEVEVPVEKIVEVEKIVTETVTEYVDVPAEVEHERFYKPGVYFNHTEVSTDGTYTYAVVVVDAYGQIAGIMFDDTKSTSEFLTNENEELYVYVQGDGKTVPNTYRKIDTNVAPGQYPTAADAITADDLVVGIHTAAINELTEIEAYETSRILGEEWINDTEALVEAIKADQSTYGILTAKSGDEVTASNVDSGDLTNVDVLLDLVQEVLDGQAALTEDVVLADIANPVKGLYTPGAEFGVTERQVGSSVTYYTSFVVVDEFGRIAGVYNDATNADKVVEGANATKWIMKEAYGLAEKTGNVAWYLQAKGFSDAVVKNQGVDAIEENADFAEEDTDETGHLYTDLIAGTTIGVEGFITATNDALDSLDSWKDAETPVFKDGTYFVTGEVDKGGHATMAVTILNNEVASIFLDTTKGDEQASVLRDDEWFPVFKFDRVWTTDANEEESETILVYLDTDEYVAVEEVLVDDETIEAGDEVTLTEDELAALEVVPGNYTKQILNDRYVMGSGNAWYTQANTIADLFEEVGPYGINLVDGDHTDTVTGVTFGHVDEYQQLFVEALLLATDADNAMVDATEVTVEADVDLPEGTYFANLEVNEKGEQYLAYMNVNAEGVIESIVFDAAIAADEYVTTINTLGDAYGLAKDEDDKEWYEQAAIFAEDIILNQAGIINDMEKDFSYEVDSTFGQHTFTDTGINTELATAFEALTTKLVEKALVAKVEMEANRIFDAIEDEETLLFSDMADTPIGINTDSLVFGTERTVRPGFELDIETTDDVLDIDESLTGVYNFTVDAVTANTDVTITYILTFDEYEFTKDITYTVKTVAAAELANLNSEVNEEMFEEVTQVLGFDNTLVDVDTVIADSFLGWFEADADFTKDTALTTTQDLPKGTHTLTAVVEYETGKYVTKDLVVNVLTAQDAVNATAGTVTPDNILDNGEVTGKDFVLSTETNIDGVNIVWDVTTGSGVVAELGTEDENKVPLTITRNYSTEKVILEATVSNTVDTTVEEVLEFEFRAVPADERLVTERMSAVINDEAVTLGVKYVNGAAGATVIEDLNTILSTTDFTNEEGVEVTWTSSSDNLVITETSGVIELTNLAVDATEEVTLTVTATVDIDGDNKVDVTLNKEFDLVLYK